MVFAVPNWKPCWYFLNCEFSHFVFANKSKLNVCLHQNVQNALFLSGKRHFEFVQRLAFSMSIALHR